MADEDLAITGKDVSIELLLDGAPQALVDRVNRFSAEPTYDNIEQKPLGTTRVYHDSVPTGWRGELEVFQTTSQLDDFVDAYNLARRNRVPVEILITSTKRFRDGSSTSHTYRDVQIEGLGEGISRGESSTKRLQWKSGQDRI